MTVEKNISFGLEQERLRISAPLKRSCSSPKEMFFSTVMCGNSAYDWNIMLTGRSYGAMALMSWPSIRILPAVGVSNPASMRSSVVLPEPDPPSRQKISPRRTSSETLSTALKSPNRLVTPWMRT